MDIKKTWASYCSLRGRRKPGNLQMRTHAILVVGSFTNTPFPFEISTFLRRMKANSFSYMKNRQYRKSGRSATSARPNQEPYPLNLTEDKPKFEIVVQKHYIIFPEFRHLAGMIRKNDHRILTVFGNNLKRRRTAKGYSLRQFAALADIDHAMIDRYEKGLTNPSLTTIARLAEALEIETFELLQDKKKG